MPFFGASNPLQKIGFDCLLVSDTNVESYLYPGKLSAGQWCGHRKDKMPFATQTVAIQQPEELTAGKVPVLEFDGECRHLQLQRLYLESGPYYFVIIANANGRGLIFDSYGRVQIPAETLGDGWCITEVIYNTHQPINGATTLFSNWQGVGDFAVGKLGAFAVKNGKLPSLGLRAEIRRQLAKLYGVNRWRSVEISHTGEFTSQQYNYENYSYLIADSWQEYKQIMGVINRWAGFPDPKKRAGTLSYGFGNQRNDGKVLISLERKVLLFLDSRGAIPERVKTRILSEKPAGFEPTSLVRSDLFVDVQEEG